MKKPKKFTVLYLSEILAPLIFCAVSIALIIWFYIRNLGLDSEAASQKIELLPVFLLLIFAAFVALYMIRTVAVDEKGLRYRAVGKTIFLSWEDVHYVKITKNANGSFGRGSYIILATFPFASDHTDFRASAEGCIVLRNRRKVIRLIRNYYTDEIINLK